MMLSWYNLNFILVWEPNKYLLQELKPNRYWNGKVSGLQKELFAQSKTFQLSLNRMPLWLQQEIVFYLQQI